MTRNDDGATLQFSPTSPRDLISHDGNAFTSERMRNRAEDQRSGRLSWSYGIATCAPVTLSIKEVAFKFYHGAEPPQVKTHRREILIVDRYTIDFPNFVYTASREIREVH